MLLNPHWTSNLVKIVESFIDQFRDEGQGVCIVDGMGIQILIVLARMERAILLCNEEERSGLWGLGQNDSPGFEMLIDEIFAHFLFLWVKGVYLSDLWNK